MTCNNLDVDFVFGTELPGFADSGLKVLSIEFVPSAADDVIHIRDNTITGPTLMKGTPSDTDSFIKNFLDKGQRMFPCIKASEQTFGTAANAKIIFELA